MPHWARWIAIAIIVAFVLEFFAIFLFTPQPEQVATPTPVPKQWRSQALASALIAALLPRHLLECNTTQAKVIDEIKTTLTTLQGVVNDSIISYAPTLIGFEVNQTIALNLSQALNASLAQCAPALLWREAHIDLIEAINFTSDVMNKTLYPRDVQLYAFRLGLPKPIALVMADAETNATIPVLVQAQFVDGNPTRLLIYQLT